MTLGLVQPALQLVAVYEPLQPLQPPQPLQFLYFPLEHVRDLVRERTRTSDLQLAPLGALSAYRTILSVSVPVSVSPCLLLGLVQPLAHDEYL